MIIGIDLGTTNSLVGVWDSNQVKVIPNVLGKIMTPSVVSVDNDDVIIVGEPALNRLGSHPELTIANFKRYMGSDKIFKLGKYSFRPEELSSLILRRLKEDAESYLGCTITEAVISVPAYFSDAQRKATKIAGRLAGLNVERLINEPTAAGIAYGLQNENEETNYLIFDLGGGTFDVSILTMFSGVIEVRASSGDNWLGGIDFTKILEEMFLAYVKNKIPNQQLSEKVLQKIREQAEFGKHSLSANAKVSMKINLNDEILEREYSVNEFETAAEPLSQRLRDPIKKVLSDANLASDKIHQIVLVGGASRMPLVKKMVTRMFGRLPFCYIDPDTVVVSGVAIQAALKSQDKALDEIVVTDVCPYSLGIAIYNQTSLSEPGVLHFDPIIERNTIIPTSRSRVYYPITPKQSTVVIKIYQGESFFVEKNIFLGELTINLPRLHNDSNIDVRFTYDVNGLLEVEATILETLEKKSLIIEGNPGVMNEKQIKERLDELKALKIHPREKTENMTVLGQAERLYEDLKDENRLHLSAEIKKFIHALNKQDEILILRVRNELNKLISNFKNDLSLI